MGWGKQLKMLVADGNIYPLKPGAMSSANGLVGTGFASQYRLQPGEEF